MSCKFPKTARYKIRLRKKEYFCALKPTFPMRYTNKKILKITFPVLVLPADGAVDRTDRYGLSGTRRRGGIGGFGPGGYLLPDDLHAGIRVQHRRQILIARRNGAKEYSQIGPLFMQSTAFLLLMALVLFILSKVFAARIMGADRSSRCTGSRRPVPRLPGLRFLLRLRRSMFRAFYVGTTRTRILTINSIVMVLTNVVLNYLLIFGKFGFPEMGIAGAAIASSISEAYPPSSTYSTPAIGPTGAAINSDSQDSTFPC